MRSSIVLTFIILLAACSQKEKVQTSGQKSYLQSPLSTLQLFTKSVDFLENNLGYPLLVKDAEKGIVVSGWKTYGVNRSQINLTIRKDTQGALLSAHINEQLLDTGSWKSQVSTGESESKLIAEMSRYLKK